MKQYIEMKRKLNLIEGSCYYSTEEKLSMLIGLIDELIDIVDEQQSYEDEENSSEPGEDILSGELAKALQQRVSIFDPAKDEQRFNDLLKKFK